MSRYRIAVELCGDMWVARVQQESLPFIGPNRTKLGRPHVYWESISYNSDPSREKAIEQADACILALKAADEAELERRRLRQETFEILER